MTLQAGSEGSDSDQENHDGAGSSRKTPKRARGKVQLPAPKASEEKFASQSPITASDYGCLSLLKKKRSGGMLESEWVEI